MRKSPGEDGVTLVELMVTMAILGIIVSAVAFALIVGLKNDAETSRRLEESRDAQLVTTYLPADIASARTVTIGASSGACSGGSELVRFNWEEALTSTATPTEYTAAYRVSSDLATGEWRLVRYVCVGSGTASNTIMARRLAPSCAGCLVQAPGERVEMKLVEASGYSYTVSGNRRKP